MVNLHVPHFGSGPKLHATDNDIDVDTEKNPRSGRSGQRGGGGAAMGILTHPILAKTAISLGLTALSLLLLVLVLLSVPGPIKGLYWFSVKGESGSGALSAGVLGWCMADTSNCTYAPLSDNSYLSTMIDSGQALTVRIMLPTACYWLIVTLVTWTVLTVVVPKGYIIKDLDSITRHLRFAVLEACVLCVSLFGCVLCWLAFGLGRMAYLSVERGGGRPKSGQAMETTAVAAVISLFSILTALVGLHIRLKEASANWKREATMVRRRSMMSGPDHPMASVTAGASAGAGAVAHPSSKATGGEAGKRWSNAPEYTLHGRTPSGSIAKRSGSERGSELDEEERLESDLELSKRNSRDQESMIRRASMIGPNDNPYAAAAQAQRTGGQP